MAIDAIGLFAAAADVETRALWMRPSTGEALVGLGSAAVLLGSPERVAAEWRALLTDTDADTDSDAAGLAGPRLLGGFSFDPLALHSQLWEGFGAGRFVLPERLFTIQDQTTSLTTSRVVGDIEPSPRPCSAPLPPARPGLSADDWQSLVAEVAATIRRGESGLRKVVLASAMQVPTRATLETALRQLAADYPSCTIFALATADACFLGATPERLVGMHDGTATTMALAGSAPRGASTAEDQAIAQRLLNDPKERSEHSVVVDAMCESLAPLTSRLVADVEPRIHALANVQHLITPIRAQVCKGRGVLDLVAGLHPTPAVGGYPRAAALELIRDREGLDRGWYAGPIGWVDARGEGEFVVGLRSALVRGEATTLFAGCGIMADSDPPTEYAEWGWKLRPMCRALGAET
ncbi:MAG TPA: isochorismate synthase [Chloroflexota bacterium]|jgi:isochorismate synthase